MISPEAYFRDNDLWNDEKLASFCEHHLVRIATSSKYPHLRLLHYKDEAQYSKTWTSFSRMCRGLIVDMKNRAIVAYPFDKFFNLGEMPETAYEKLVKSAEFEVSEKLDGSMIILFKNPETGAFCTTTKGSFDSEHGAVAQEYLPASVCKEEFVTDYTLIFELIDPRFPIVVNYKKKGYAPGLYLTGARKRRSNTMLLYTELQQLASFLGIPCMKTYSFSSLDDIITQTKNLSVLEEGYVLYFPKTQTRVKVKGTAYLKAHRFISKLSDKYLIEYLQDGQEKEILLLVPEEYYQDVVDKINYYKRLKLDLLNELYEIFAKAPKATRKDYALYLANSREINPLYHRLLFLLIDGVPLTDGNLYTLIAKRDNISTQTRI